MGYFRSSENGKKELAVDSVVNNWTKWDPTLYKKDIRCSHLIFDSLWPQKARELWRSKRTKTNIGPPPSEDGHTTDWVHERLPAPRPFAVSRVPTESHVGLITSWGGGPSKRLQLATIDGLNWIFTRWLFCSEWHLEDIFSFAPPATRRQTICKHLQLSHSGWGEEVGVEVKHLFPRRNLITVDKEQKRSGRGTSKGTLRDWMGDFF